MPYTATVKPDPGAPELPTGRELHEHARASTPSKGLSAPEAFTYRRERITALEAALDVERAAMHELVREAYDEGVTTPTIGRWSGYTHGWIRRILEAE